MERWPAGRVGCAAAALTQVRPTLAHAGEAKPQRAAGLKVIAGAGLSRGQRDLADGITAPQAILALEVAVTRCTQGTRSLAGCNQQWRALWAVGGR